MLNTEQFAHCIHLRSIKKGIIGYVQGLGITDPGALREIRKQVRLYLAAHGFAPPTAVPATPTATPVESPKAEKQWGNKLKLDKAYYYNEPDDKYVLHLKAAGGNVILPGEVVRNIQETYSNWLGNPHTINEVCRNHRIPRNYLVEILKVLGITHDKEPTTTEVLEKEDIDILSEELVAKKRFQLYQTFQKKSWQQTQEAADKWHNFQEGIYDPFSLFLENWVPPVYKEVPGPKYTGPGTERDSRVCLVGLSDLHYGTSADPKDSFQQEGQSTAETVTFVEKYADAIAEKQAQKRYELRKCIVASLGDILHTTGQGTTTKGTPLRFDCLKEEQFEQAFNSMVNFLNKMLVCFEEVEVKSVKGNHNDFGDWVLFRALSSYFRTCPRISFDVFRTDHGMFRVNSTLFVISHGASAEFKAKIPKSGSAREAYIGNLFLSRPEALVGVKHKILLTADQHHLEMQEYAEFEHYMLSTPVKGDKYAEALGLRGKPRQTLFTIGQEGIESLEYVFTK